MSNVIRSQATGYVIFRARRQKEYEFIEEMFTALLSKKEFKIWYDAATKQPFSFGYINTAARELNDGMFNIRFEHRVSWAESDSEQE